MYSARAVLRWLDDDAREASLSVVWLPMLPTDNAAAACSSATMFRDPRVKQFWDPDRLSGLTWSAEFQAAEAKALLDSMPPDHGMREFVEMWIDNPSIYPVWDVAYFFAPEIRWGDHVPTPSSWTKQVGFWGGSDDDTPNAEADSTATSNTEPAMPDMTTGDFWTSRRSWDTIESDWYREIRLGMDSLGR